MVCVGTRILTTRESGGPSTRAQFIPAMAVHRRLSGRRGWRMSALRRYRKNWGSLCAGCLRNGGPLHAVSATSRGRKFSPRLYRFGGPPRGVLRRLRCLQFFGWLGARLRARLCYLGKGIAAQCLDLQGLGSGNTGNLRVTAFSVLVPARVNRGLGQRRQSQAGTEQCHNKRLEKRFHAAYLW